MGLAERLHAKGWSQAEIDHALHHLAKAKAECPLKQRIIEEALYWLAMVLLAAGSVAVVVYLIPFLDEAGRVLGWPDSVSFTLVGVLGVVIGILFAHVLHDIADLEPRHHFAVLFFATLTVAVSAAAVSRYNTTLAATFATVFVLYYSVVWWSRGR